VPRTLPSACRAGLVAALTLGGWAFGVSACSPSPVNGDESPTLYNVGALDGGAATEAAADAASETMPAAVLQGSPLCNAVYTSCYPDRPTTAKTCGEAPDGGPYSSLAGYDNALLACRVALYQSPICAPAGPAGDGSWCESASECQPAFDCVGSGTCQHYCCSGNAECTADEFCDIQPTVLTSTMKVPVCMPIHPAAGCQLLDPTACPVNQTCAVVRDDGATSCVALGTVTLGGECDTVHCAAGLVCLGTPGSRTCFQLCTTTTAPVPPAQSGTPSIPACLPGQTCQGGLPLFPDPAVGICN
jgi:hypothetical protein